MLGFFPRESPRGARNWNTRGAVGSAPSAYEKMGEECHDILQDAFYKALSVSKTTNKGQKPAGKPHKSPLFRYHRPRSVKCR
jgi:hypothetical protein